MLVTCFTDPREPQFVRAKCTHKPAFDTRSHSQNSYGQIPNCITALHSLAIVVASAWPPKRVLPYANVFHCHNAGGVISPSDFTSISTSTFLALAPIAPPGWFLLKTSFTPSSSLSYKVSATVSASMSPTAIVTVVEVVGAQTPKLTSSSSCIGAGNRIVWGCVWSSGQSAARLCEVIARMDVCVGMCGRRARSSAVLPE
jgi:hypothetical protein